MLISKKMFKMREHLAAIIIQKSWRGYITRQRVKVKKQLMNKCASRIQSAWRFYWFMQIGPRIRKAKFNAAATVVQKYIKGFLGKKNTYKILMQAKVNSCYDYFKAI
jgi:hypothetical protein